MLHGDMEWNYIWKCLNAFLMTCSTSSPSYPIFTATSFSVFLVPKTWLKNRAIFVKSKESIFCVGTATQSTLLTDPFYTALYLWIHYHQANTLSDTHWSNCPMLIVGVHGIFFITALLSFHHQLHQLDDLIHLNLVPYITPRRIHMQFFSVPVWTWPDTVDATDQDCVSTLCETRLVRNSAW